MTKNLKWMVAVALVSGALGAAGGVMAAKNKEIVLTPAADVKFQPMDPNDKEGKGPQISVVFGDPKKKAPIGFLLKVPAGMKAGAHSHSSDDYAVIVKGTMHNFAPGDEGKGLTAGGTWFQPGKMVHDNHCEAGSECLQFVYMPNGLDFIPAKTEAKADAKPAKAEPAKVEGAKMDAKAVVKPAAEAPKPAEPAKK
jgi:hypothetical protein